MIKDLFVSPEAIEVEIYEIEKEATALALKLSLLSQKIKYIISKIESSSSCKLTDGYFELLGKIQEMLASLVFKHDIGIPDNLYKFMQDFDNLDHYKDYLFKQIKSGNYQF